MKDFQTWFCWLLACVMSIPVLREVGLVGAIYLFALFAWYMSVWYLGAGTYHALHRKKE